MNKLQHLSQLVCSSSSGSVTNLCYRSYVLWYTCPKEQHCAPLNMDVLEKIPKIRRIVPFNTLFKEIFISTSYCCTVPPLWWSLVTVTLTVDVSKPRCSLYFNQVLLSAYCGSWYNLSYWIVPICLCFYPCDIVEISLSLFSAQFSYHLEMSVV